MVIRNPHFSSPNMLGADKETFKKLKLEKLISILEDMKMSEEVYKELSDKYFEDKKTETFCTTTDLAKWILETHNSYGYDEIEEFLIFGLVK